MVAVMREEGVIILTIDETMHRKGENVDLSRLRGFSVQSAERGADRKQGGGKLVVVFHERWDPDLGEDAWVNNECIWILVYRGSERLAVCSVYMAAENTVDGVFTDWNNSLYSHVRAETASSREKDLNAPS